MQRFQRGGLVAAALAIIAVMIFPAAAVAVLEDEPSTSSTTNPNIGSEDATWRWSWGNSRNPDMMVDMIPADGTVEDRKQTLGFIYEVRQIDPSGNGTAAPSWDDSSLSPKPDGTFIRSVFDINRVNDEFGWTPYPGASVRGEGMYAVTFLFYNQFRVQLPETVSTRYRGLDFTAPAPVANLTAPTGGLQVAAGKWTESRSRDIAWDRRSYDALSGVGGYKVSVNSSDTVFVHNTAPDSAYEPYAFLLNGSGPSMPPIKHFTVEGLRAGESTIIVRVVDRATNESQARSVKAYVDFDTPTLKVTAPSAGAVVGMSPSFSVVASDAARISRVSYYVDNVLIGASTTAPFGLKPSLSSLAAGAHVLKVVAEDQIGSAPGTWNVPHTVTSTVSFTLDKTPVKVTGFSRNYALFYPILRDSYYDNLTIKYTLNKKANVTLYVRDSSGTIRRTMTATKGAGNYTFVWDGKWSSDGKAHTGTYSVQVVAKDIAGYSSTTPKLSTVIRNYELVRTGPGSVKVVPR